MKIVRKILIGLASMALALTMPAYSQVSFVPGQLLTAGQLNYAFSNVLTLSGGALTGPLTVPAISSAKETLINGPTSEVAGEMASNFLDDEANRRSIQ